MRGEMTLGDIVTDNARRFPDVPAYRLGHRTVTHAALRDRALRLVSAMAAAGVRRQDRIAVLSRNSVEFGELIAATQLSGIIIVAVNFRLSPPEVFDVLRRIVPSIVFYGKEFAATVAEVAPRLPGSPLLVSIGDFEDFIAGGDRDEPASKVLVARPDDIACLLFTSGTTGASKCCVLGQRELRRVAFTMNAEMRSGSADRGLINMPMFHFGAMGIIGGLHARGGTVVLQEQFDAAEAVRLIAEERITVLHLAPVMLRTLLDEVSDDRTVESVRTVVYSAAPMTLATVQRALAMLPDAGFLNLYGQTEAIVSGLPRELHGLDGPRCGRRFAVGRLPVPRGAGEDRRCGRPRRAGRRPR